MSFNQEIKVFRLSVKLTEISGCSIYKEWKTIRYLNRLDSTIHKEIDVLEDQ